MNLYGPDTRSLPRNQTCFLPLLPDQPSTKMMTPSSMSDPRERLKLPRIVLKKVERSYSGFAKEAEILQILENSSTKLKKIFCNGLRILSKHFSPVLTRTQSQSRRRRVQNKLKWVYAWGRRDDYLPISEAFVSDPPKRESLDQASSNLMEGCGGHNKSLNLSMCKLDYLLLTEAYFFCCCRIGVDDINTFVTMTFYFKCKFT
ncbi:hypothetical protein LXL04_019308 [Taraxacum kok-saghyz]